MGFSRQLDKDYEATGCGCRRRKRGPGSSAIPLYKHSLDNSCEKWRKQISVMSELRGQARVQPIDKLDEACTNADDRMMLVRHRSGNRVMS